MIKLFKPFISQESKDLCLEVLNSDQIAEGKMVKDFEDEFSRVSGHDNVVAVNSGTSALELAYELADIRPEDEVIVPVLTCTATNLPLVRRKAHIIFADIDRDLNISIEDVKNKLTSKTKAIVFVHFGGNNRGLKEINNLCSEHKITLIEDAAQSIGSNFWGIGDYACISLQAIKTVTSGDGGFIITKSKADADRARRLRWFGYDRAEKQKMGDTDLTEAGYKYHMNNVSAAIGLGNLRKLPEIMSYMEHLKMIYEKHGFFAHAWLAGSFTDRYEELKRYMKDNGVEIGQHHYRNDKYTIFGGRQKFPVMDEVEYKYFFVPYHMGVRLADADRIAYLWKNFNK